MTSPRHEELVRALPYARRYARALTGSQPSGDALVAESVTQMMADTGSPAGVCRLGLYGWVTRAYDATQPQAATDALSQKQRQLLLLTSLEEVSPADAAPIVGLDVQDAMSMLAQARERLRASSATEVLIIEDEPIIAMDLEELVQSCGHRVVGVASSEKEAIEIAERTRPGLILADINLGHGGDGSHAVAQIMRHRYAPVIFVTAYPERLLTGEALEPVFVITKPFEPLTLAIATYQAVTGGVRLD
jgi:CheY-like chemotaxis protein